MKLKEGGLFLSTTIGITIGFMPKIQEEEFLLLHWFFVIFFSLLYLGYVSLHIYLHEQIEKKEYSLLDLTTGFTLPFMITFLIRTII